MKYTENDFNQIVWLLLRLVDDLVKRMEPETEEDLSLLHEIKLTREFLARRHPHANVVGAIEDIQKLRTGIQQFIPKGWSLEDDPNSWKLEDEKIKGETTDGS